MSKIERRINLAAVIVPLAAFLASIPLLWNSLVGVTDLAILAAMYLLTGLGITVGFHRLLTHRSFQTRPSVQYALAGLGSMAVQGPVIRWVADHRKHHAHTDEDGDPHSPHTHGAGGVRGVLVGLYHAHVGWLFSLQGRAAPKRYARDLLDDPGMRRIDRHFPALVGASLLIPFAAGLVISARPPAASRLYSGEASCGSSCSTT